MIEIQIATLIVVQTKLYFDQTLIQVVTLKYIILYDIPGLQFSLMG